MLPLAIILKGLGHIVQGSDRSRDQGRTPEKFAWLETHGVELFPQDGSGITEALDALVISTAVEESIPDVAAAETLNVPIRKRADILAEYFNAAKTRIAIAGTSGKTTTTGMVGFLLKEAGFDPIVMNGGIFRNYANENPYATALVGRGDVFVTEADESDGSIALYEPDIAVVHNITLDHKPLDELKTLFGAFLAKAKTPIINSTDPHIAEAFNSSSSAMTYSVESVNSGMHVSGVVLKPYGVDAVVHAQDGQSANLSLQVPGLHNLSNALAALSVGMAIGLPLEKAALILSQFTGIKRRMEFVGEANNIAVIDDFAHNPDKIAATLTALRQFPGRLHIFFQPHGYGFLKLVKDELANTFASHVLADDKIYLVEPLYLGGTVDRSVGAVDVVNDLCALGVDAVLCEGREQVKEAILANAEPGDRIIVMGARDDTLSAFASDLLRSIT